MATNPQIEPIIMGLLLLDPLSLSLGAVVLEGVALDKDEVAFIEVDTNVTDVEGIMKDDVVNAELVEATLLLGGFELTTTGAEVVITGATVVVCASVVVVVVVVVVGGGAWVVVCVGDAVVCSVVDVGGVSAPPAKI